MRPRDRAWFALIGLTIVSVLAFYGQRMLSGYLSVAVNFDVSYILFNNLLTLDQYFFQGYPTGELISRMQSDVELIWRLLALMFTRIGSAALTLVSAMVLLGAIHLPLKSLTVDSVARLDPGRPVIVYCWDAL